MCSLWYVRKRHCLATDNEDICVLHITTEFNQIRRAEDTVMSLFTTYCETVIDKGPLLYSR